jgi:CDP-6-deoxy-D-xylo-4-hexulose-3-dehydrase
MSKFKLPLMSDNIARSDIDSVVKFLQQDPIPQLTNGPKVREFEAKWSEWLGVKRSLFVNSGTSANQLTLFALRYLYGDGGEILVPTITWVSDIASVIQNGFTPVFCDINLNNLGMSLEEMKKKLTKKTRAVFITHVLGLNALSNEILNFCKENNLLLIEDNCEGYPVYFNGQKTGTFGLASNFSFYFAHHMSTIEGGMISTDNEELYQYLRAFRSHAMPREMTDDTLKQKILSENPQCNKDFIFIAPAYNFRSTEINAVLGLNQIKKLNRSREVRAANFAYFLENLDKSKYFTEFALEGQNNYALVLMLKDRSFSKRDKLESTLTENGIEFRRGLAGGGNQVRQPYLKRFASEQSLNPADYPNAEHVSDFSMYIGNYPSLELEKIDYLTDVVNAI